MITEWLQTVNVYFDKKTHLNQVPLVFDYSGCFSMMMNCQYMKLLKVLSSCEIRENKD